MQGNRKSSYSSKQSTLKLYHCTFSGGLVGSYPGAERDGPHPSVPELSTPRPRPESTRTLRLTVRSHFAISSMSSRDHLSSLSASNCRRRHCKYFCFSQGRRVANYNARRRRERERALAIGEHDFQNYKDIGMHLSILPIL